MTDIKTICEFLKEKNISYLTDAPLAKFTTFGIGGNVDLLINISNVADLCAVLRFFNTVGFPYTVIGNGSNILVSDRGISGAVIHLCASGNGVVCNGESITAFAGEKLSVLCKTALENELTGLEFAWGIPASVGGAVYMNAGAYISETSEVVESVLSVKPDGSTVIRRKGEFGFSYRHSIYADNAEIIAEVTYKLKKGKKTDIKAMMDDFINRRKAKQPLEYMSAGSTFKRPRVGYAAALIDQCGLKGYTVGGAGVSEKHAGFVVNYGNATCSDVIKVIEHVREKVNGEKGILLEPEVIFLGRK